MSLLIALTSFGNFDLAACPLKNQHNLTSKGSQVANSNFALSSHLRFICVTLGEMLQILMKTTLTAQPLQWQPIAPCSRFENSSENFNPHPLSLST